MKKIEENGIRQEEHIKIEGDIRREGENGFASRRYL